MAQRVILDSDDIKKIIKDHVLKVTGAFFVIVELDENIKIVVNIDCKKEG